MVNYNEGKIYKIVCNITGLVYIGSTTKKRLCDRLSNHKSHYKRHLEGKSSYITSFKVLENGCYEIILLELYPCNSKDELHSRERFYVESLECVNNKTPSSSHSETMQKWYSKNKERVLNKQKKYNETNLQKRREYEKKYRELNKDKISIARKKWETENKEYLKIKKKEYPVGIILHKASLKADKPLSR